MLTDHDESFWDNYPANLNSTISPDDIKLFIGRIMQYGYTGTVSMFWYTQNEGGDKLAWATATQLLIWETVVGERDADFNKVSPGSCNAVLDQISTDHSCGSFVANGCSCEEGGGAAKSGIFCNCADIIPQKEQIPWN